MLIYTFDKRIIVTVFIEHLCGLVVRVPGSIPDATRFSNK
jgi:hypothetical protein